MGCNYDPAKFNGIMSGTLPEKQLKRYLIFAGDTWYPGGGWSDFIGSACSIEECLKIRGWRSKDWYHIIDTITMEVVENLEEFKI